MSDTIHLIIGSRGLIGSALCKRLAARGIEYLGTTRRVPNDNEIHCDLTQTSFNHLRSRIRDKVNKYVDVTYLVAAMSKYKECESSSVAWHVNVDAPIAICAERLGFQVFVSSDAVEWNSSSYARHKAQVESVLLSRGYAAVVRPSRVDQARVEEFADVLIDVGLKQQPGVTRWK